jgi:hypothetical protein
MKKMLADVGMIFVGTSSKDGIPNVSVRTAYAVLGNDTIIMLDYFRHKTFWNWQENNRMAISVANKKKVDGYQFKGRCEIVTDSEEIRKLHKKICNNPHTLARLFEKRIANLPPIVVKFIIEEIYTLKPIEMAKERIQ